MLPTRTTALAAGALSALLAAATLSGPTATAAGKKTTVETYDDFSKPGYSLTDYDAKWANPYGLGEMASHDTRSFKKGNLSVSAVPFTVGYDFSVFDHLKYIAVSTRTFPVPTDGSVEISSTIKAATPGTQPGRVIEGTYVQSGLPYAQPTLEGQQAGAVMNVIDFATGQLFDWFVSGHTAFALVERLPSGVTAPGLVPGDPGYVGLDKAYTQIVAEIPSSPGAHSVSVRFSRTNGKGTAEYVFDGRTVATVQHVGVPLDVQGVPFTRIYPSLGAGEELGGQINSLAIGHGLFSLLDAFPFQHPERPDLAVSIPVANRLFGQGASATFDDFKVKTVSND